MHRIKRSNDNAMWFIQELSSQVVAESGCSHDRHHLGKLILQSLKNAPDFILQIDGGTGKSETCGSILERSVKCANGMRALGLQRGDVIIIMAPNHLDPCIPYYAALYLGIIIAAIDRKLQLNEIQGIFAVDKPKMVFCQSERGKDVRLSLDNNNLSDAKLVTFDENSENIENALVFTELLNKYGNGTSLEDFRAADFDPEETIAVLISTSGSTGLPKQSVSTHKALSITGYCLWSRYTQFPTPINISFVMAPLQWLTTIINFNVGPLLRFTRLQTSSDITPQHCSEIINKYRPNLMVTNPVLLAVLLKCQGKDRCDLSCFDTIYTGGCAAPIELLQEMNKLYPDVEIFNCYGVTETGTAPFSWDFQALGSCGKPISFLQYRLIDVGTKEDIVEPNKPGELWLKGPGNFKGYYKNPEATQEALTEDGWFRTGDLFYRDENWNFYFIDRIKLLLNYRNNQVSPVKIQDVIKKHPGVQDVIITGIPDPGYGDLPVACIVPKTGCKVDAQEIKNMVKESLSDPSQLRGGVIFLDKIPYLPTAKVDYRKLKEIAFQKDKE